MEPRLILLAAALLLSACGPFRSRPDLKGSTMTLPGDGDCARGYKMEGTGTVGQYGTPVGVVTQERCKPAPDKAL